MDELRIPTAVGDFAAIDFGGPGVPVVALHELVIHNAASWEPVASRLAGRARLVALDREGHGLTLVPSAPGIDVPRTMREITEHLGFVGEQAPILVGCGGGGWDATAAVVSGAVPARGLVTTEATYCMPTEHIMAFLDEFDATDDSSTLWGALELGWTGSAEEVPAAMERLIAAREGNWVVGEVGKHQWEATVRRAFVETEGHWLRQPLPNVFRGMALDRMKDDIRPGPEAFAALNAPARFLLAEGGLYAYFRDVIDEMVAQDPRRRLRVVPAIYNVLSSHPQEIAHEIRDLIDETA